MLFRSEKKESKSGKSIDKTGTSSKEKKASEKVTNEKEKRQGKESGRKRERESEKGALSADKKEAKAIKPPTDTRPIDERSGNEQASGLSAEAGSFPNKSASGVSSTKESNSIIEGKPGEFLASDDAMDVDDSNVKSENAFEATASVVSNRDTEGGASQTTKSTDSVGNISI